MCCRDVTWTCRFTAASFIWEAECIHMSAIGNVKPTEGSQASVCFCLITNMTFGMNLCWSSLTTHFLLQLTIHFPLSVYDVTSHYMLTLEDV